VRDLYTSFTGASAAWRQLELIANNVANASTQGFREQRQRFELVGETSVKSSGTTYNREDGELATDGVQTHLALRGEGFFALGDGTATRDGGFRLDTEGQLVTADGTPVLTDGGPVQLDPGETMTVSAEGLVTGSLSGEVGRLQIVQLANATPLGGGRWSGTATPTEGAVVVQGAREGSNVDAMRSMVELIEASRFFEAQEKVMQTSDDMQARLNRVKG
jgi:flagellar basal-body rod protein FlgF